MLGPAMNAAVKVTARLNLNGNGTMNAKVVFSAARSKHTWGGRFFSNKRSPRALPIRGTHEPFSMPKASSKPNSESQNFL
jgi:hypothetical protein